MQTMEVAAPNDPVPYRFLGQFLPLNILVTAFANFFTLLISVGAYGPSRRFWRSFEVFISLAWLFFLMSLTLSIVAQMILSYQRHHALDAFGRGRDGYRKWRDGGMGSKSFTDRLMVAFVVKMPLAFVIMLTTLIGFMFCSLCIVSHCLAVGWIGFTWTMLMMVLAIVAWVFSEHA